jgi:type I restriction enzyme R subunit
LRNLVALIDKDARKPVYTDFEDEIGSASEVVLPGFTASDDFEKFRSKARAFLRAHQHHVVIHKLRMNRALTPSDVSELERILGDSGLKDEQIQKAKSESHGLGLFVRSLIGMDRGAAKEAFATFLTGKTLSANQIEFINLVINHLTEHGVMEAKALYESPFTDIAPQGPDGIFSSSQVDELIAVLDTVNRSAAA